MGGDPGERGWDLGDVSPPTFLNVNPPKGKFLQKYFLDESRIAWEWAI